MDKINFQDYPSTDTPINSTNLNTLQNNVESEINKISSYSTTETIVGKWINNKSIYRKVITGNSISSDVNTGITGYEDIIDMKVFLKQSNATSWRPLPWLFVLNDAIGSAIWAGGFYFMDGILKFQVGSNLKNISKFIAIIEYTKTN